MMDFSQKLQASDNTYSPVLTLTFLINKMNVKSVQSALSDLKRPPERLQS